jgi:cyanophycinase
MTTRSFFEWATIQSAAVALLVIAPCAAQDSGPPVIIDTETFRIVIRQLAIPTIDSTRGDDLFWEWHTVDLSLPGEAPEILGRVAGLENSDVLTQEQKLPALTDVPAAELPGPLVLIGGSHQDLRNDIRDAFFELAGGKRAKIVVIPTAVAHADRPETPDEFRKPWLDLKPLSVEILHTRDRKTADDPAFVKPLTEASAVFLTNGHGDRLFKAYRGTLVEKELKKLQARGGLIGGTGTGAVVLGDLSIDRVKADGPTEWSLGLLPGFLIHDRGDVERLADAIAANPANVGLMIDPAAAVVIRGKNIRVIGEGTVTVGLAKGAGKEAKIETLKSGGQLDLIELRRAAVSRAGKEK